MKNLSPRISLYPQGSHPPSVEKGSIALPYYPESRAFGDGSHPTTCLCAGAVDFLCRQMNPDAFLDVGTGTGVLARIARAQGARFIVGTDVDPIAIASARENIALDGNLTGEIQIGNFFPDHFGPRFNLVVANILEGILRELAPALSRALTPNGILLLSGFTAIQTPFLKSVFENLGLGFISESHLGDWSLLMFRRKSD